MKSKHKLELYRENIHYLSMRNGRENSRLKAIFKKETTFLQNMFLCEMHFNFVIQKELQ